MSEEGDLADAKNVGTVLEEEPGVFCLTGIAGTIHNVVATLDANEDQSFQDPIIRAATDGWRESLPRRNPGHRRDRRRGSKRWNPYEEEVSQGFFVMVN